MASNDNQYMLFEQELHGNLTNFTPLSTTLVLQILYERHKSNVIYSQAGQTLLAVNPYCHIDDLYGKHVIKHYSQNGDTTTCDAQPQLVPHIYEVANSALHQALCTSNNQAIFISGESGAGKTVSAKHLLTFLVSTSVATSKQSSATHNTHSHSDSRHVSAESLHRLILQTNPLLEAFGNAQTIRNDNSSRFGKYLELFIDRNGRIHGAAVQTYLLEKTRVVTQADGETNFHIFYQLLHGASVTERRSLLLPDQHDHTFSLTPLQAAQFDISARWQETRTALDCLSLTADATHDVLRVLSSILHLGNLKFVCDEDDENIVYTQCTGQEASLEASAELLGVDSCELETTFLYRLTTVLHTTRKSVFRSVCTPQQCVQRRDALAKLLYHRLFEYLIEKINSSIEPQHKDKVIGLLDIYGFESFQTNSLEQMCINYANERLQQHYVTHFLKDLQCEYVTEGLRCEPVQYYDNQCCVERLDDRCGLFALINEECYLKRSNSDEAICSRLTNMLTQRHNSTLIADNSGMPGGGGSTPRRAPLTPQQHTPQHLLHTKPAGSTPQRQQTPQRPRTPLSTSRSGRGGTGQHRDDQFVVYHYAGDVVYTVQGLVEKNKDDVPTEVLQLLHKSTNPLIHALLESYEPELPGKKKKTVLAKFKHSMDELMDSVSGSTPHYVRCLKPNRSSAPGVYDEAYMREQLDASGITETIHIAQTGFPDSLRYEEVLSRYTQLIRNQHMYNTEETTQLADLTLALANTNIIMNTTLNNGGGTGAANTGTCRSTLGDITSSSGVDNSVGGRRRITPQKRLHNDTIEEENEGVDTLSLGDEENTSPVKDALDDHYEKQLQLTPRRHNITTTPKRQMRRRLRRRSSEQTREGTTSADHTRKLCATIMQSVFSSQYTDARQLCAQFGRTKLFFQAGQLERLDKIRSRVLGSYAFTIQCAWRRYVLYKQHKQRRTLAMFTLQAAMRGYLEEHKFIVKMAAVRTLQRHTRKYLSTKAERCARMGKSDIDDKHTTRLDTSRVDSRIDNDGKRHHTTPERQQRSTRTSVYYTPPQYPTPGGTTAPLPPASSDGGGGLEDIAEVSGEGHDSSMHVSEASIQLGIPLPHLTTAATAITTATDPSMHMHDHHVDASQTAMDDHRVVPQQQPHNQQRRRHRVRQSVDQYIQGADVRSMYTACTGNDGTVSSSDRSVNERSGDTINSVCGKASQWLASKVGSVASSKVGCIAPSEVDSSTTASAAVPMSTLPPFVEEPDGSSTDICDNSVTTTTHDDSVDVTMCSGVSGGSSPNQPHIVGPPVLSSALSTELLFNNRRFYLSGAFHGVLMSDYSKEDVD